MERTNRVMALDALRGFAILMMVLSGQIAWGILPAWMYHAQVPPPEHLFNPGVLGITWVDLVFPFFLFSMGAALPLSIGNKIAKGESVWKVGGRIVERGLKLAFFAIFIQHFYPWVLSDPQDMRSWLLALGAFALLFPMFVRYNHMTELKNQMVSVCAMVAGTIMMLSVDYAGGKAFSLGDSNIIILVLANMAFFGGLLYLATIKNRWMRIGILPFIMAVMIGSKTEGSWNEWLMNATPAGWLYQFMFLKYLFIIVPGIYAGEYIQEWIQGRKAEGAERDGNAVQEWAMVLLSVLLIGVNLYGLFTRQLVLNAALTAMILIVYRFVISRIGYGGNSGLWAKLYRAGAYMLLLGLAFEAYEGGIRKDPSTYSYYLVTSGLACFALIAFTILCDIRRKGVLVRPLEMAGQNPMIAYVSGSLLLVPLMQMTGLIKCLDMICINPWLGFLRGVIVTAAVVAVTAVFTRLKIFWRT